MTGSSRAVHRDVERAAQQFDAPALLDVLALLGYRDADVTLQSEPSSTSRSCPIEDVELGEREAQVRTSIGLLGPQSPLPSFFLQAVDTLEDPALRELLGVLDHHALALRFASLYPERDPRLAGGAPWEQAKQRVTRSLGLASPSTLHWLFSQVFPELAVVVRRGRVMRHVAGQDARIGALRLGVAAVGGDPEVPTGGIEVTLTADDVRPPGRSWPGEVARRLREQILPTLDGVELDLTVRLRLFDRPHPLRLAIDGLGGALESAPHTGDDTAAIERVLVICSGAVTKLVVYSTP